MLKAVRYRVQNFRNIDDSGWIPLDSVTAFVGRNESGKTALLKALHKFNPASAEPYSPQRDFPRDRYTREFRDGADWPVSSVAFAVDSALQAELAPLLGGNAGPTEFTCTRYYDGSLQIAYTPDLSDTPLERGQLLAALDAFASGARRLAAPAPEQEQATQATRSHLANWATTWHDRLSSVADLRGEKGTELLAALRADAETKSSPPTATLVEALLQPVTALHHESQKQSFREHLDALVRARLPVFIYFENYGILDSAIYLPRFLTDLDREPTNPRIRTINALFKHVNLTAADVASLGKEQAETARAKGQQPTDAMIAADQEKKEARAIKLNSASIDISRRFSDWWSQRRHKIRYHADGDYFRVWVADDKRPDVEIELEARSKGFQWFFSFYLVFLVESDDGHRDTILLLDEPALHLHPTAQQELITFIEALAAKNQVLYTTHSPFLIDGEHLHRVRAVTEDDTGHSRINSEGWPADYETIFPLQAAAGYAMARALFQNKKNVLVEGMSDYYYLKALSQQCASTSRAALPDDIYITPCGGAKNIGHIASLFMGQGVKPVVLLDGDSAGHARRTALLKDLYAGTASQVIMLDTQLKIPGAEIEDLLGEAMLLPAVATVAGQPLALNDDERRTGSLPAQIQAAASRQGIALPDGWKASAAIQLVSSWAEHRVVLPDAVLDRAARLFRAIVDRFQ